MLGRGERIGVIAAFVADERESIEHARGVGRAFALDALENFERLRAERFRAGKIALRVRGQRGVEKLDGAVGSLIRVG